MLKKETVGICKNVEDYAVARLQIALSKEPSQDTTADIIDAMKILKCVHVCCEAGAPEKSIKNYYGR